MVTGRRAGPALSVALAAGMLASCWSPAPARADSLALGAPALTVADGVPLRQSPDAGAEAVGELASGTIVTPVAGPFTATDGSVWYEVDAGGYVPAPDLAPAAFQAADTTPETPAASQPADSTAPSGEVEPTSEPPVADEAPEATALPVATEVSPNDPPPGQTTEATAAPSVEPTESPVDAPATDPTTDPGAAPVDPTPGATTAPVEATEPPPASTPPPTAPPDEGTAGPDVIGTVWIVGSAGAACHAAMDLGSAVLAVFDEGTPVDVVGQTIGDWQPVLCNGATGYLRASSIAWYPPTEETSAAAPTSPPTADREPTAVPEPTATPAAATSDAAPTTTPVAAEAESDPGQRIVDVALGYLGYPYVRAAEGPNAFDCSGFTLFVLRQALGLDVTHDMFVQYDMGTKVDRGSLQPGDLVFFQNTIEPGLSHVGIYIGHGQFVNAENETTGVVVSDLDSDYYGPRWYGAVRYP